MARSKVTRGAAPQLARSNQNRGSTGRARAPGGDDPNFLSTYFREMSELSVMSADQERASAMKIFQLRQGYWKSLLSYPPFIDGVVALIESEIDAENVPSSDLRSMRSSSRCLRDRETRANKDDYSEAVKKLSEQMGNIDTDGIVADMIAADVNTLDAGSTGQTTMAVAPPRSGSRPFADFVERVRQSGMVLRHAKNRFIKANLRLVVSIARRFNHGRMPLQDLIQEGNIGLMKAVDRFDYRKGYRFSTYGSWWIRHAISRAVADKGREVRLPVHMIDAYHKLNKARREIEAKRGREPSREELAEKTGFALSKIEKMGGVILEQAISLDKPVSGDDGRRVGDFLEDGNCIAPGEQLAAKAMNEHIRRVLTQLRPIEADILRKRFGLVDEGAELTLKEIGGQYSLSRERIRQLQEQALGKIRRDLKRREMM